MWQNMSAMNAVKMSPLCRSKHRQNFQLYWGTLYFQVYWGTLYFQVYWGTLYFCFQFDNNLVPHPKTKIIFQFYV